MMNWEEIYLRFINWFKFMLNSKYILFLSFFVLLNYQNGLSQRPYTELVFPADVNLYPLLICNSLNGALCDYNNMAENFIEAEKKSRKITHVLLSKYSIEDYDSNKYPYVIFPCELDVANYFISSSGNRESVYFESKHLSYEIYDRRSDKFYRPYAKHKRKSGNNSDHVDYRYPIKNLTIEKTRLYFKDLSRIIKNLDKVGPKKTFKKELKRQGSGLRPVHLLGLTVLIPIAVGVAILI